jgi:hypothetical protein
MSIIAILPKREMATDDEFRMKVSDGQRVRRIGASLAIRRRAVIEGVPMSPPLRGFGIFRLSSFGHPNGLTNLMHDSNW